MVHGGAAITPPSSRRRFTMTGRGTHTYGELRQQAYFECGRKLVKVAQAVLDDYAPSKSLETVSQQGVRWAIDLAARVAKQANEQFTLGHEQTRASQLAETVNSRAWTAYSQAISRFETR